MILRLFRHIRIEPEHNFVIIDSHRNKTTEYDLNRVPIKKNQKWCINSDAE